MVAGTVDVQEHLESIGDPLYNVLNAEIDVQVANPAKIKKPPASKFKKSDRVDAKWISHVVFVKDDTGEPGLRR